MSYTYMHIYIPSLLELPATTPATPSAWVVTEHWAELYSGCPLAGYFTPGVHVWQCCCVSSPCAPLPPLHPSLCSPSAPLFLPWKEVHLYHFSRSHLYVLIYNICFHLFDFTILLSHKKEWNEVFCREVDDPESVIQISCTFNGSLYM